ncbi:DEKNAAC101969 [Brettanomyces naardenensis]|uniref:Chloride channel protein n=1 Tax=Brettanomyces naardenensis TaxID=13370 RepID=A0A448YJG7_BRENA|nr:DEKNAAC101969 [Brettanomyces naardenensis]
MLLHDLKFGICLDTFLHARLQCGNVWSDWGSQLVSGWLLKTFINFVVLLITAIFFVIIAFLIASRYSSINKSGIAEMKMIISGLKLEGFLDFSMILNKILSLIFVIASGLWLGYEGPLVHIACSLLNTALNAFSRFGVAFQNEALRREFLASGISIGIALAFNAPIGGVLFALEQIQSFFPIDKLMWNSFVCTTIGVTVLQMLHPFKDSSVNDSFRVDHKNNWLYFEAFFYVLLGLLCGALGIAFNRLNIRFASFRKQTIGDKSRLKLAEVLVVAAVTNILAFFLKASHLNLNELMSMLFTDCADDPRNPLCLSSDHVFPYKTLLTILFLLVKSYFISAYTYGISLPGGVLVPSLTIGALIGRLLGVFLEYFQSIFSKSSFFLQCYNEKSSCISVASYAVVGSASFFAAVTNMSVASVVIVSELTGALNYIIPIMMGVFCAKILNDLILGKSLYELWLIATNQSYLPSDLEDTMTISQLSTTTAAQLMSSIDELEVIWDNKTTTLRMLKELPASPYGHPILKSPFDPQLIGFVTSYEIAQKLDSIPSEYLASPDSIVQFTELDQGCFSMRDIITPVEDLFVVNPNFSLLTAYQVLDKLKMSNIFVCHAGSSKCRGMISKQDLVELVHSEDRKLKNEFR